MPSEEGQPPEAEPAEPLRADRRTIASGIKPKTQFDQDQHRELVRGQLASRMVWILAGTIAGTGLILVLRWATVPEVKDLLSVILPPLVALTGSALGFYFGGKRT